MAKKTSKPQSPTPPPIELPAKNFPIVGIGASAGGLAAFEAFFSGMAAITEPGMAFVLVQHLAPDHKSILVDLIGRYTPMQVLEVADGMTVQPNCVYIIPPNSDMAFLNGSLHLLEPTLPHGQRMPIDFFFRSLAQDQHERAICIILSGTGSDGTLGLREIKSEGGMVMAQTPASTNYSGMPSSAIATGLVDYELSPPQMPAQLIAYVTHTSKKSSLGDDDIMDKGGNALKKIFILLRTQLGHDFSQYKPKTINRRIDRRMAVHQIETLDGYVKYLQKTPAEVEALFRDLLIGVTSFFRDPEAFMALESQIIPKLFSNKPAGGIVRVWSLGCSTGEEAYSIAILLQEHLTTLKQSYKVQVFATDIDSRAVATARAGLYPASIAIDLTPERLARFFTLEANGTAYRIHKSIRDMMIFSEQDVIKDPPFSKLDLISCRNLLIYMGGALQKKLIPLFHYALNPGGMLFLGSSETVGEFSQIFDSLDRNSKLFLRKEEHLTEQRVALAQLMPPIPALAAALPAGPGKGSAPRKPSLRELTEQALLQLAAPAAALINAQGDILYLHGRTGMYLEPTPGETDINNILKMAREGLRHALIAALHKAISSKESVYTRGLSVKTNGHFTTIDLTIRPVFKAPVDSQAPVTAPPRPPLYLVILNEAEPVGRGQEAASSGQEAASSGQEAASSGQEAAIESLRRELRIKEECLQSINEEMDTSNEELKSSNEEMQSVNEELQSTNEELETSKEELQSINEELATVNAELQTKVTDLSRTNNDMNNLLAGTGIATVFVDYKMNILRFTPSATQMINLIPGDIGRPAAHLASNLVGYTGLLSDAQAVLSSLIPKELDVQTSFGKWYTMRIQPYRTLENVIEGVVITFVENTELKTLRRLATVVLDSNDAIIAQGLDGTVLAWNSGAVRLYGWSEAEALTMNIRDLISENQRENALSVVKQLSHAAVLAPYRIQRIAKDGGIVEVMLTATALVNNAGKVYAIATTEREVGKAG
jgi:two-component system CheB/CheR fusion protein